MFAVGLINRPQLIKIRAALALADVNTLSAKNALRLNDISFIRAQKVAPLER
jgi:hypothetical protein